jgi:hypothetical protein
MDENQTDLPIITNLIVDDESSVEKSSFVSFHDEIEQIVKPDENDGNLATLAMTTDSSKKTRQARRSSRISRELTVGSLKMFEQLEKLSQASEDQSETESAVASVFTSFEEVVNRTVSCPYYQQLHTFLCSNTNSLFLPDYFQSRYSRYNIFLGVETSFFLTHICQVLKESAQDVKLGDNSFGLIASSNTSMDPGYSYPMMNMRAAAARAHSLKDSDFYGLLKIHSLVYQNRIVGKESCLVADVDIDLKYGRKILDFLGCQHSHLLEIMSVTFPIIPTRFIDTIAIQKATFEKVEYVPILTNSSIDDLRLDYLYLSADGHTVRSHIENMRPSVLASSSKADDVLSYQKYDLGQSVLSAESQPSVKSIKSDTSNKRRRHETSLDKLYTD